MKDTTAVLLMDGDTFVYQAALVNQRDTGFEDEDGNPTWNFDVEKAKEYIRFKVNGLHKKLAPSGKVVMALSSFSTQYSGGQWRLEILPTYKQNRAPKAKPKLIPELREFIKESYQTVTFPGLEGDDVLGILHTSPRYFNGSGWRPIICSADKDMKTIPGEHYNFNHKELFHVSVTEANYWHMYQTLTGDRVDGYRGCPGVGDAKAKAILAGVTDPMERWALVACEYLNKGLTEADALQQARVARILQHMDYNLDTDTVIPWNPPR